MPEEKTGRERLEWLKRGHIPLVQGLFDEAYACGHKDGRADGEAVIGMLEAARSELAAAQAPVVEWTTVGRSFVAVVGSMEMIVTPDDTPSVWSFGWQLSITGTHSSDPFCVILDSGAQTGDAGKAACIAAYRKAAGL